MTKIRRIRIQDPDTNPDPDPLVRGMDPSTPKCHGSATLLKGFQDILPTSYHYQEKVESFKHGFKPLPLTFSTKELAQASSTLEQSTKQSLHYLFPKIFNFSRQHTYFFSS
jgi:hypothetical protein